MTTSEIETVYSTSTGGNVAVGDLSESLCRSLELKAHWDTTETELLDDYYDPYYDSMDYCFVCSRVTDHRGEHDDLVEQELARYSTTQGVVYAL